MIAAPDRAGENPSPGTQVVGGPAAVANAGGESRFRIGVPCHMRTRPLPACAAAGRQISSASNSIAAPPNCLNLVIVLSDYGKAGPPRGGPHRETAGRPAPRPPL